MNTTNRLAEISTVVSVVRSFGKHSVVQLKEGLCIFIGDKPSAGDMCAYAYEDTLIRINFIEVIGRAYSWDVETEVRAELKYEGKLRGFSSFRGLAIRNSDPNKRGLALSLKALAIMSSLKRDWIIGENLTEYLEISPIPANVTSKNQLINPEGIEYLIETGNAEKIKQLFTSRKLVNRVLLGDGDEIRSLNFDSVELSKIKECLDFLITQDYLLPHRIVEMLHDAGNDPAVKALGIEYKNMSRKTLERYVIDGSEESKEQLIRHARRCHYFLDWAGLIAIAEANSDKCMVDFLNGLIPKEDDEECAIRYGATYGHFDGYGMSDDQASDLANEYSQSYKRGSFDD